MKLCKECWVQLDTKAIPSVCRAHHSTPRKVMKEGNRVKEREEKILVCAHLQSCQLGMWEMQGKAIQKEKQVHVGARRRGSGKGRLDPESWVPS